MRVFGMRLVLALIAVAAAWAAPRAQPVDAGECLQRFRQFDRVSARYPDGGAASLAYNKVPPADLTRVTQRLVVGGCQTWTADLDGMEAYAASLQGFRIAEGPTAIRPALVHLGVLTSVTDEVRVTIVFRGLGYNSRGIGAMGLGRRIYVGPFHSQEALDQAITVALGAGFETPNVPANSRF
jgi:hypothetical protein